MAHTFGSTWFRFQASTPIDPVENSGFTEVLIQSELEYPLDVVIGGAKISKELNANSKHPLKIKLYLWKNLNNPREKMQDSDWFGAKKNNFTSLYKVSYTQSSSKIDWTGGEIEIESKNHILLRKKTAFGIKISADYSSHKLYGVAGWQNFPDEGFVKFDELQDTLVLTYKLWHIEPSIYAKFEIIQKPEFRWKTTFLLSPLVIAKDKDDHVLRNKNSETTAYGFSLGFNSQTEHVLDKNLSLITEINIHYFRTEGDMSQRFYGDDPYTKDQDETGLELSGINNVISMFTQQISLSLRHSF